jgi:GTPase involved in cell partitioning and DNA repair
VEYRVNKKAVAVEKKRAASGTILDGAVAGIQGEGMGAAFLEKIERCSGADWR